MAFRPDVTLVRSFEEAQQLIEWAEQGHDKIAIDTETSGFENHDRVRTVQLGSRDQAFVIPMDRLGYGGLLNDAMSRMRGTRFLMHNFTFDTNMLAKEGVVIPFDRIDDTRIKAFCCEPYLPSGLKPVADRIVGPYCSEGDKMLDAAMRKGKYTWATVPIDLEEFWWYGGLDTVMTVWLDDHYDPMVKAKYQRIYDLEYAAQIVLRDVVSRGVRIDPSYCTSMRDQLLSEAQEWRDAARWYWGIDNLTSDIKVRELMLELGYEPDLKDYTAGGKPSMGREILNKLVADPNAKGHWKALAEALVHVKHLEKMAGSQYLGGFIDMMDENGLLHPSINPIGARTGRMSVSRPALQTLHRDALVRDAFVPREGCKLVFADYDQMEVRLTAYLCGDPDYQRMVRESSDIHTDTAALLYKVDPSFVTKPMRQRVKNVIYAKLYGAGPAKFALTAGISVEEAVDFLAEFDRTIPGVVALQNHVREVALERYKSEGVAYVTTPYGRRHPLAPWEVGGIKEDWRTGGERIDGEDYKLMNYLIQGFGADELKRAVVDAQRAGISDYLVLLVHDEMGWDVPEKDVTEVTREIVRVMENHEYDVPLTVDAVVCDRWGDKYR